MSHWLRNAQRFVSSMPNMTCEDLKEQLKFKEIEFNVSRNLRDYKQQAACEYMLSSVKKQIAKKC